VIMAWLVDILSMKIAWPLAMAILMVVPALHLAWLKWRNRND